MANNKILSIVIPTRNRYETLTPLLESICLFNNKNFEVIIHDNSDNNDNFLNYFEKHCNDSRFQYYHVQNSLSAIENCDLAVSKSCAEFVIFIGDDDGVSHRIFEFCEYMLIKNIDSAMFNTSLYSWPNLDYKIKINSKLKGKLFIPDFKSSLEVIDVEKEYKKVLYHAAQSLFKLPRLYHGIIRKDVLEKMFLNLGTYFPGPVPDMSNAVALTKFVNLHVYLDIPLVISGHSKKSMSGKNVNRKHQGELTDEMSLPKNTKEIWDKRIPIFWSAPTIWAMAFFDASKRIGKEEMLKYFKYYKLYSTCFVYTDIKYFSKIFNSINNSFSRLDFFVMFFNIFFFALKLYFMRIRIYLRKKIFKNKGIYCEDISMVIRETNKNLDSLIFNFDHV